MNILMTAGFIVSAPAVFLSGFAKCLLMKKLYNDFIVKVKELVASVAFENMKASTSRIGRLVVRKRIPTLAVTKM